jgi:ergothioneine biosynthesis protein EgtB
MTSTSGAQHAPHAPLEGADQRQALAPHYLAVRRASEALCRPLAIEDYGLQTMPEASPPKWHLAHTSWFFETFLLTPYLPGYRPFHPQFEYLFNSYYEAVGPQFPRPQRGLLSRPTVEEVYRYRAYVDAAMAELINCAADDRWPEVAARITLGCHHEEQHQELLLTDIKYNFSVNPLRPAYRPDLPAAPARSSPQLDWIDRPGGIHDIGHDGEGFGFDNEGPRHRIYVQPYSLAARLVTHGEYLEFIEAQGYQRPEFWLADGWRTVRERNWEAPLYWERSEGRWWQFTLGGLHPVAEHAPVCHLSYYEAEAYARFRGKRLPTEQEWELAAASQPVEGNFRESGFLHPQPSAGHALFGDVWEWTRSAYLPYPGYRPPSSALGEYNGKFMANQMVLRGGSCATPAGHVRATYRNFFYPADRWQFAGIRLADDR